MFDLITTIIYQPFLNVLVFFYWLLGLGTDALPDMGVAVILLTILIRLILLPISWTTDRSVKERYQIAQDSKKIDENYGGNPIELKKKKKKLFTKNRSILVAEVMTLFIQVTIALMLWRIFNSGLTGQDLHLIYSFMPDIELPFNLMFLGKYDLTHSSYTFNFIQSGLIFVLETLSVMTSPVPHTRAEVVRLQLILPIVSFLIFLNLPAGKKLFIITTLIFSIILKLIKFVQYRFLLFSKKMEDREEHDDSEEKLLVDAA